jgi:hypothetical protein
MPPTSAFTRATCASNDSHIARTFEPSPSYIEA